ncbi:MAG: hypothetical protein V5A40_12160 [Haloarculaceae archaeon]
MEPYIQFRGDSYEVAQHIRDALEAAFDHFEIEFPQGSRPGFSDENVKIQKLVYRVAEDRGLPIIRTWYRYGQFEPYSIFRPSNMSAGPLENPEGRVPAADDPSGITRQEIMGYLIEEDLIDDWKKPLFEFLRENYEYWAAEDYRDIYLTNLQILETLEEIHQEEELIETAEHYVTSLKAPTMDLYYELNRHPAFGEEVQGHLRAFFDDLQTALVSVAGKEDIRPTQVQAIRRASPVYHNYIWPWPAMLISVNEARGPEAELPQFTERGHEYITEYSQTYPNRRRDWKSELSDADLVADPTEFQQVRGRVSKPMGALETASLLGAGDE